MFREETALSLEIMGSKMDHSKLDANPPKGKEQQMLIVEEGEER